MLILLSGLLLSATAVTITHAALSTTTANTIEGTKPYLLLSDGVTKLTSLDELAGFSMWDGSYESGGVTKHLVQVDASMAGTPITTPAGFTFNDVHALVLATGSSHSVVGVMVGDDDGDAGTAAGTMNVEWKDNGVQVPLGSQGNQLSVCGGLYTLEITVDTAVSANTTYGAPRTNVYGTNPKVTYTFLPQGQGICYIKPGDMTVNTTGSLSIPGGYNTAKFDLANGFNASAGFPTTGFEKAVFSVIGSGGDQSKYRCTSSDDGGKITLSGTGSTTLGAKCTVTYNSTTRAAFTAGGTPTINLQYNTTGSTWVTIDSYTIPTPVRWAIGMGRRIYSNTSSLATSTQFPALDACRVVVDGSASPATTNGQANDMTVAGKAWRQKYLYRRDELTNSPYADVGTYPELSVPGNTTPNYYSRDVDGTFMGEWGVVYNYAGSGWAVKDFFWTAEAWSTGRQFVVHKSGYVSNINPDNIGVAAVCRG